MSLADLFFGSDSRANETCSCGATFRANGMYALVHADDWRRTHPCPNRRSLWETAAPKPKETTS